MFPHPEPYPAYEAMPFRDVSSPVDQRKISIQALCFSATKEESFQMVGWKLVHMIIKHFFVS